MVSDDQVGLDIFNRLLALRSSVDEEGRQLAERWRRLLHRADSRESCLNLAHYVALRQRDLRSLQYQLPPWGVSSLGRSEGRVLPSLDATLATLGAACGAPPDCIPRRPTVDAFHRGDELLEQESARVLGRRPEERRTRIMVTLSTEAATDQDLVRSLVQNGMDIARINCAHDRADDWLAMAGHVRRASEDAGRPCRVHMDLAGPKLRTVDVSISTPDGRVRVGERIWLVGAGETPEGESRVGCSVPEVIDGIRVGEEIWFDDGKLGGVVTDARDGCAGIRVTSARPKGERIRAGKGVNLPQTHLVLPSLTIEDREHLKLVAEQADSLGLSFVRESGDIAVAQDALLAAGCRLEEIPLIVKVETVHAVENLPEIIARGMGRQPFGLMIARGDLAVEIGFLRLAEIQEEILWLAEAAHVPVVWATQVLERVVKKGRPSRGEVTDAAMGDRAECVMLNKGPHIAKGVAVLSDLLRRMQGHMHKKTPLLRALKSWPLAPLSREQPADSQPTEPTIAPADSISES